jgi:hypothetical protein
MSAQSNEPKLTKLVFADVYRDGGSYSASFETADGAIYSVWLQRSKMPDSEGAHHRWLFEYFGMERPQDCPPIVTGSAAEKALFARLRRFLADQAPDDVLVPDPQSKRSFSRLRELVYYAERREPCFSYDLPKRERD